jgi:hypothetical protein
MPRRDWCQSKQLVRPKKTPNQSVEDRVGEFQVRTERNKKNTFSTIVIGKCCPKDGQSCLGNDKSVIVRVKDTRYQSATPSEQKEREKRGYKLIPKVTIDVVVLK